MIEKDGQSQEASFRSNLFDWRVIFRVELKGFHYNMSQIYSGWRRRAQLFQRRSEPEVLMSFTGTTEGVTFFKQATPELVCGSHEQICRDEASLEILQSVSLLSKGNWFNLCWQHDRNHRFYWGSIYQARTHR